MRIFGFKLINGKSLARTALGLALSSLLAFSFAPQARAQDGEQQDDEAPQQQRQQQERAAQRRQQRPARDGGGNLLLQLNLTPEQLAQMREIRSQSETEARALMRRLNIARRALDEAIYSDNLNEASIEEHAREVTQAHAALVRLRAQTEFKVRRVLSPEQLQSFRDLRQQARSKQRLENQLRRGARRGPRGDSTGNNSNQRPDASLEGQRDSRPFPSARERRRGGLRRQP